jgi:hypothetical protein
MKLEDIQNLWKEDVNFVDDMLDEEALKIPRLHQKYYKVYTTEKLLLRKLEADLKIYQPIKYEYYAGELAEEDLREHGWEPFPKKVLRADIPRHVDSDRQVIERTLKIAHQKEKVDFCDAIIKSLRDRGFLIKSAIDWRKFTNGAI